MVCMNCMRTAGCGSCKDGLQKDSTLVAKPVAVRSLGSSPYWLLHRRFSLVCHSDQFDNAALHIGGVCAASSPRCPRRLLRCDVSALNPSTWPAGRSMTDTPKQSRQNEWIQCTSRLYRDLSLVGNLQKVYDPQCPQHSVPGSRDHQSRTWITKNHQEGPRSEGLDTISIRV